MTVTHATNQKTDPIDLNSIISSLQVFHNQQAILCDQLESLADGLPDHFDIQEALIVARQIMPVICDAHQFEETMLFNLIDDDKATSQSLERLRFEHWEDEASGEDLADALLSYAKSTNSERQDNSTDKLAYMLRGFFDNLRRHIAFEAEYIIPAVERKKISAR